MQLLNWRLLLANAFSALQLCYNSSAFLQTVSSNCAYIFFGSAHVFPPNCFVLLVFLGTKSAIVTHWWAVYLQ